MSNNKLGEFIRQKRGKLSLRDFASKFGISHTMIDCIEKGFDPRTKKPIHPTVEILSKIARGLSIPVSYLAALANGDENDPAINQPEYPVMTRKVPVVGTVKCGPGDYSYEEPLGYEYINDKYKGDIIALRTKGDSMKDLGIKEGDLAFIRLQPDVEDGDVCVVIINQDEGMLKRMRKFKDGIILESANADYAPIIVTGEDLNDVHIVGKVIGVQRWS